MFLDQLIGNCRSHQGINTDVFSLKQKEGQKSTIPEHNTQLASDTEETEAQSLIMNKQLTESLVDSEEMVPKLIDENSQLKQQLATCIELSVANKQYGIEERMAELATEIEHLKYELSAYLDMEDLKQELQQKQCCIKESHLSEVTRGQSFFNCLWKQGNHR